MVVFAELAWSPGDITQVCCLQPLQLKVSQKRSNGNQRASVGHGQFGNNKMGPWPFNSPKKMLYAGRRQSSSNRAAKFCQYLLFAREAVD